LFDAYTLGYGLMAAAWLTIFLPACKFSIEELLLVNRKGFGFYCNVPLGTIFNNGGQLLI
jgi:hypothetical protein